MIEKSRVLILAHETSWIVKCIVVTENIFRKLELGLPIRRAALEGSKEIFFQFSNDKFTARNLPLCARYLNFRDPLVVM